METLKNLLRVLAIVIFGAIVVLNLAVLALSADTIFANLF